MDSINQDLLEALSEAGLDSELVSDVMEACLLHGLTVASISNLTPERAAELLFLTTEEVATLIAICKAKSGVAGKVPAVASCMFPSLLPSPNTANADLMLLISLVDEVWLQICASPVWVSPLSCPDCTIQSEWTTLPIALIVCIVVHTQASASLTARTTQAGLPSPPPSPKGAMGVQLLKRPPLHHQLCRWTPRSSKPR